MLKLQHRVSRGKLFLSGNVPEQFLANTLISSLTRGHAWCRGLINFSSNDLQGDAVSFSSLTLGEDR